MPILAGLANCSPERVKAAVDLWVPKWFAVAKAFTRLTWLDEFPYVFSALQPLESARARRRRRQDSVMVNRNDDDDSGDDDDGKSDDDDDSGDGDAEDGHDAGTDDDDTDDEGGFDVDFVCLDGKVFDSQRFHSSHVLNRACFSSKTQSSGLQSLVWSMPCGFPFLVTDLFGAKLSEQRQVKLHSRWLKSIPHDVAVLQDRGFRKLQRHYPKCDVVDCLYSQSPH